VELNGEFAHALHKLRLCAVDHGLKSILLQRRRLGGAAYHMNGFDFPAACQPADHAAYGACGCRMNNRPMPAAPRAV